MACIEESIKLYFYLGLNYDEILVQLAQIDKVVICMSTLKRTLLKMGLYRKKNYSDILDVALFILEELQKSGQKLGYRPMWLKCIQHEFVVTQDTVLQLLHILHPEGIEERKSHRLVKKKYHSDGSNYTWHFDGYDKIKPYGICISGCIDGFARFAIWLEAWKTNSDPRLIAGYFMNSVKVRKGCPRRLRADKGTENVRVKALQLFLRRDHDGNQVPGSYLEGSSNMNQRIERFWGIVRTQDVQYWMDLFENLKHSGLFTGSFLDKALIQFCFMEIIQVCHCFKEITAFSRA